MSDKNGCLRAVIDDFDQDTPEDTRRDLFQICEEFLDLVNSLFLPSELLTRCLYGMITDQAMQTKKNRLKAESWIFERLPVGAAFTLEKEGGVYRKESNDYALGTTNTLCLATGDRSSVRPVSEVLPHIDFRKKVFLNEVTPPHLNL
jgi:hypothetical protein